MCGRWASSPAPVVRTGGYMTCETREKEENLLLKIKSAITRCLASERVQCTSTRPWIIPRILWYENFTCTTTTTITAVAAVRVAVALCGQEFSHNFPWISLAYTHSPHPTLFPSRHGNLLRARVKTVNLNHCHRCRTSVAFTCWPHYTIHAALRLYTLVMAGRAG